LFPSSGTSASQAHPVHARGKLAWAQQAEASGKGDGEYFIPACKEGAFPPVCLPQGLMCKDPTDTINRI